MRRAPIVLAATVVGTAGVLLFKPLSPSSLGTTSADASAEKSATNPSEAASGSGASTGSAASSAATPTPSPTTGSGSSSTAEAAATVVETGSAVTTRFGTTQVRATIRGGRIIAVTTLSMNDDDPRSQAISEAAIPTLRDEVLSKQTAAVDTVSGATYTSLAYEASLQAALDKAGYRSPDGSKASTATPNEG